VCRHAGVGTHVTSHAHSHETGFDLLLRILALGEAWAAAASAFLAINLACLARVSQVRFAPASDTSPSYYFSFCFLSFSDLDTVPVQVNKSGFPGGREREKERESARVRVRAREI
jgi:hypothetical protein